MSGDGGAEAASAERSSAGYSAFLRLKPPSEGSTVKLAATDRTVSTSTVGANSETIHRSYEFSRVLPPTASQEEVADLVRCRVADCLQSRDSLIVSNGAAGSGKTYTLLGTRDAPGVVPRALYTVFLSLESRLDRDCPLVPLSWNRTAETESDRIVSSQRENHGILNFMLEKCKTKNTFTSDEFTPFMSSSSSPIVPINHEPGSLVSVWVSYYEVYNDQIFDLLFVKRSNERKPLGLGYDATADAYTPKGLRQYQVRSWDEAFDLYRCGRDNVRAQSSGAHSVFTVKLLTRASTGSTVANLLLCELACPERVFSAIPMNRTLVREMQSVNKSLLTLSKCLAALREPSATAVHSYRESRLTMLLKIFLTGHAQLTIICNVTLDSRCFQQTQQVLKMSSLTQKTRIRTKRENGVSQPAKPILKKRFSSVYGRGDPVGGDILAKCVERLSLKDEEHRAVEESGRGEEAQIDQLRAELAVAELKFRADLSAERDTLSRMVAVLREHFNVAQLEDPLDVVSRAVAVHADVKTAASEELAEVYHTAEQLEKTVAELRAACSSKDEEIATLKGRVLELSEQKELNENLMASYSRRSSRDGTPGAGDCRGVTKAQSTTARKRGRTARADPRMASKKLEFTDRIKDSRRQLLGLAHADFLGDDFAPLDEQPPALSPATLMKALVQSAKK